MRVVVLCLALLTGCASVQRVGECVAQAHQGLKEELTVLIWNEVMDGWHYPSDKLVSEAKWLARQHGSSAVRCVLRGLMRKWSEAAGKEPRRAHAHAIARDLERKL